MEILDINDDGMLLVCGTAVGKAEQHLDTLRKAEVELMSDRLKTWIRNVYPEYDRCWKCAAEREFIRELHEITVHVTFGFCMECRSDVVIVYAGKDKELVQDPRTGRGGWLLSHNRLHGASKVVGAVKG